MAKILPLVTIPNPSLREKSVEIPPEVIKSQDFQDFCADLAKTMMKNDGMGIAAVQVGKNIRVFIVNTEKGMEFFINPKIIKKSWAKESGEEGCLSVPKTFGQVMRHKRIKVHYLDRNGNQKKMEASDLFARAIQHENDHLDGILFIDKAEKIRKYK